MVANLRSVDASSWAIRSRPQVSFYKLCAPRCFPIREVKRNQVDTPKTFVPHT
jgi:hypothetical protein